MTKIWLGRADDIVELFAFGHSGYGTQGTDIVCAGISVLVESFTMFCQNNTEIDVLRVDTDPRYGKLHIIARDKQGITRYPLEMLEAGLKEIESNYPENLVLEPLGALGEI